MLTMELNLKTVDKKELIRRTALESDTTRVISEPTTFTLDGEVVIIYGKTSGVEDIRQACKTIKYEKSDRTNGLKTESRIFGFKPRRIIRGDFCSSTGMSKESPKEHQVITQFGKRMDSVYQNAAPRVYARHHELVEKKVLKEWVIPGTVFTSGIVNKNNSLNYHLDSGNFKDCLSCMLVLKKDISGGMLSIPEFDIRLDLQDQTYLIFDGQKYLHGVTPIKRMTPFSYRYSLVYYSLQNMCNCLPFDDELKRVRIVKKAREEKRLDKNRTEL